MAQDTKITKIAPRTQDLAGLKVLEQMYAYFSFEQHPFEAQRELPKAA